MIVVGVSSTVFVIVIVIVMVLGVLAYLHDGAKAVRNRDQRKERAAALYGRSGDSQDGRR